MIGAIAKFEIKYHLKSPVFYILTGIFALLAFFAVASEGVQLGGAIGNVHRNSPYVTMQMLLVMSIFGVLSTTAFVANSVHRDFDIGIDPLFFTAPIKKYQYLAGRFLGSYFVALLLFAGVTLAILLGSFAPWLDPQVLGPVSLKPYLFSLVFIIAPTLFLVGAVFFSIAALTRSLMYTYAGNVGFIVAWAISRALLRDIENEKLSVLLDPFGFAAYAFTTRYWTVFEKNTRLLPLGGPFLLSRMLWIGIALAVLALAFWKFNFAAATRKAQKKRTKVETELPMQASFRLPQVQQTFGGAASWRKYLAATKLEAGTILKSIPFVIILLLGVMNIWGNSTALNRMFGTPVYPVTHLMVTTITGAFSIYAAIIAAFFAGELVFRERTLKLHEVHDVLPAPTWVLWAAKFTALLLVCTLTLITGVLTALIIQTGHGYHHYELAVYASGVMLEFGVLVFLLAGFSFFLQVVTNNKYVGFLGVLLYIVLDAALPALHYEHNLYRFGNTPPGSYSDMNGWGHFIAPRMWLNLYWTIFVMILVALAHLMWVRGTESGFRQRLRIARQRFGAPVIAALALFFVAFVSTGCYVYYNTNVLNRYQTSDEDEKVQAEIEKKYKKYQNVPQPRIADVQADVDLYPERRAVTVRGRYVVENRTKQLIAALHVVVDNNLDTIEVNIPGSKLVTADKPHGYWIYKLATPMAPGARMPITFRTSWAARGFVNGSSRVTVVENGTFINNGEFFPQLGYQDVVELQDRNKRRKYGLAPLQRMKPPTDVNARMNNQVSRDADWVNLDTTVSTSADQIALAPGYLQREWNANGRRYFHYKTTSPILAFWSYLSARYQVKRAQWHGIPIEVYYDAKHPYNVDRMLYAVQKSLDYYTKNFSPYQHQQVRILEFPLYRTFAQSFPNTIPFSEGIGFIADLRDKESIDYVFYVTAHEVAHQWWAHQVIGGNVQGSTMLVETMAQYSALMVMEKEYGRAKMQKFLKYELDQYLRNRGGELIAEQPLALVENQPYIHYRKGSLVMYALRDYLGEEAVNRALSNFIRDYKFSQPPYPTALDLVRYFRAEARPEQQEMITDLFERITLYDNKVNSVTATKRADGKYVVTLNVAAAKLRADEKGEERPVPMHDMVDIGVFGANEKPLFFEKRLMEKASQSIQVVVNERPVKAGIDPYNKLIDRNPKDNTKSM